MKIPGNQQDYWENLTSEWVDLLESLTMLGVVVSDEIHALPIKGRIMWGKEQLRIHG